MTGRMIPPALILLAVLSPLAVAQEVGSNAYVDMYFGDWHASSPRVTHGSLEERDILTRGDPFKPTKKGAVLRYVNSYSHATLAPHASTNATRLDGKQEIFCFLSGQGMATAGGDTAELGPNIWILMPASLEFTIKNTGDKPLTMYLITEPTPTGFRPNPKMLVRDENTLPITSSNGRWSHIVKTLYVTEDGLGTLQSVLTIVLDPLTIGQPHEGYHDLEEVWTGLEGTSLALVGPFLRRQGPGVAYLHPPDNLAPHTNLNYSQDEQIKFLYFAWYNPHEPRK
jgi:mannose-6-phosphate isomerase-like protein (cupin superfamily)